MEISGIGGYRDRDRDGLPPARSSARAVSRSADESSPLLTRPPLARSLNSAFASNAYDHDDRLIAGGQRASEPILLDFDLPTPALKQQPRRAAKASERASTSDDGAAGFGPRPRARTTTRFKRKNLPRLDNITPVASITEEQKTELKQAADDRIASMLTRAQAAWDGKPGIFEDPKQWKLHSSKPNLVVYRQRESPNGASYHPFVATGRVPGLTLQDIQYGLYAETTPDERATNAYWFSDFFLDAAVLEAFETQTDDDRFRFFGLKWLLTGMLGGVKVMSPRDSAYIHYTKTVTSDRGEKILARVDQSVPSDIVPLIPDQGDLRFVRSDLSIVYLYHYDVKANEMQVFCEGSIDPAGRSPAFMANVHLSLFAHVIVHLDHIAEAKFITKHGLIFPHDQADAGKMSIALSVSTHIPSPTAASTRADSLAAHLTANWVPDHQRKACYVCFKSFGLLRRHRHHCRMCGEVMCSRCTTTLPLVAPPAFDADEDAHFPLQNQPAKKRLEDTNPHGFPVVNTFKLCKKCIFMVRQERRAMVAGVGDYYFTEGMLRHREQMQAAFAGKYYPPFVDDDGASGFPDDDESIVDDIAYSRRIEKLRQEHMEREKQKLRDQHRSALAAAQGDQPSVRLFDDDTPAFASSFETLDASTNQKHSSSVPVSDDASFDFDSLVVTNTVALLGLNESDRFSAKDWKDWHETPGAGGTTSSTTAQATLQSRTSLTSSNNQSESSGGDAAVPGSLMHPIDERQRSYSIPEQFEIMERSIAEQEALLSSIQHERSKPGATPRLPIGAVMRSMALSSKAVGGRPIDSDSGASSTGARQSLTNSATSS